MVPLYRQMQSIRGQVVNPGLTNKGDSFKHLLRDLSVESQDSISDSNASLDNFNQFKLAEISDQIYENLHGVTN